MPYAPGVRDERGAIWQRGLTVAGDAIGRGLEAYGEHQRQKQEEAKSRSKQTKALQSYFAEVDPENADHYSSMGLDELQGTMQGFPERQKQRGIEALGHVLNAVRGGQPQTDAGATKTGFSLFPNNPAMNAPAMAAAGATKPSAPQGFLDAIAQNPRALQTPEGQAILTHVLTTMLTPKQLPEVIDINGTPVLYNPNTGGGRPMPRQLAEPGTTPPAATPPPGFVWTLKGRNWTMERGAAEAGDQPPDATPPAGYLWVRKGSKWEMDRAARSNLFSPEGLKELGIKPDDVSAGPAAAAPAAPAARTPTAAPASAKPAAAPAAVKGGVHTLESQEQYDGLQTGDLYYDAQGNVRRKQ